MVISTFAHCPAQAYQDTRSCFIVVDIYARIKLKDYEHKSSQVTYSLWCDEVDCKIHRMQSAASIGRFVDTLGCPYAGAYSTLDGMEVRLAVLKVHSEVKTVIRVPGKIIFMGNKFPVIFYGIFLIELCKLQDDASEKSMLSFPKLSSRLT